MKVTGDQYLVKKINKSIVLETIRSFSPLSRAQVSEKTGLNKGTVSSLVNELIESELVREIGLGESSGGRKPLMLLFNREAGYAIGMEIRIDSVEAIVTDLSGTVALRYARPLEHTEFEYVYSVLKDVISSLLESPLPSRYGIVGIGIGVPGIVDEDGNVLFAPNLKWRDVPLKQLLDNDFNLPVMIDNEANAGAIGERMFGIGREASHLIYLSVSYGIGAGIVIHNELYKGVSGYSGEAGHLSIQADGKRCSCGSLGCWELYASENALLSEARRIPELAAHLGGAASSLNSIESLIVLAEKGQPEAVRIFEQIADALGAGIASLVNLFNPELIIIGNRMALAKPWIQSRIEQAVELRGLSYHRAKVSIDFSKLALDAALLGAASFAVSQFLTKIRVLVD